MATTRSSTNTDELIQHLERGLGKGLVLLRGASRTEAGRAVMHVCIHETRWDPDREDRSFYLAKALTIANDAAIEEEVLDRWEKEMPWKYRGPWSDVGLVLAGLGHPRAMELVTIESGTEEWEEGPGFPAAPEGMSDVREWLEAIREDARLRIGGGLRIASLIQEEDLPAVREALEDTGCVHLQEAVAVAFTRIEDDEARDWFLDTLEGGGEQDGMQNYWWWQGLSGQSPVERSRILAIDAIETAHPICLQWILRTLVKNGRSGDEEQVAKLVKRSLQESAEDAVAVAIEWMPDNWQPEYEEILLAVLRTSGFGPNRAGVLELAARVDVTVPREDLLLLLEDAELACRIQAMEMLGPEAAGPRLRELCDQPREDPAFVAAAQEMLAGSA